jgi:hypothetical protein
VLNLSESSDEVHDSFVWLSHNRGEERIPCLGIFINFQGRTSDLEQWVYRSGLSRNPQSLYWGSLSDIVLYGRGIALLKSGSYLLEDEDKTDMPRFSCARQAKRR